MTLLVSGNHRELIQFFLIPSSSLPAILGFPWLACHNPQTDWTSGSVTGWSTACHAHCLRSTLPPASPSSNIPPATADLTLAELCSKCGSDSLDAGSHGFHLRSVLVDVVFDYRQMSQSRKVVCWVHRGQIVLSGLKMGPKSSTQGEIKTRFISRRR